MKTIIITIFLFITVTFSVTAQDSTAIKKYQADLELITKNRDEANKKLEEIKTAVIKMDGIMEYIQYQIAEEQKKFQK